MSENLVSEIGTVIIIAIGLAYLARILKQPLILAYVLAGVICGPKIGFGLVHDHNIHTIHSLGELGLIFLLFMIGLEINLKKLIALGKPVIFTGIGQVSITVIAAMAFFILIGASAFTGEFDLIYIAASVSLSSTMVVVKLLYDKRELDTIVGRTTLGVLVIQDIWAILFIALQPNFNDPQVNSILFSLLKGIGLVIFCMLASNYVLPRIFKVVSRQPEILLLLSLAWCFCIAGLAGYSGLSREMGALVAGVSLATFPYNHDVIDRIITLRDFFVTLFFVALGLEIPMPTWTMAIYTLILVGFVLIIRFITIFPILYTMRQGVRVSLVTTINLAQMSEFALVFIALGTASGHISANLSSSIVLAIIITSTISTYSIQYNHNIYLFFEKVLLFVGIRERFPHSETDDNANSSHIEDSIVILGFFREASSLLFNIKSKSPKLLEKLMIVDFNPEVTKGLIDHGVKYVYGDISRMGLLEESGVSRASIILLTVPDMILAGTNNLLLVRELRKLAPNADIIVTAETFSSQDELYDAGANYVVLPRLITADYILNIMNKSISGDLLEFAKLDFERNSGRNEVIQ
tara:strand:+ start:2881 stop:4617 length:1737 start_codon:yes stop_codon:yes gene_type:complete